MTNHMFSRASLSNFLTDCERGMSDEISSLEENRVLKTSAERLCGYFVEKYRIEPTAIDESGIQVDYGDAQIDVSRRCEYVVFDRRTPTFVTGTRITFFVPFSGDPDLFWYKPSTFTLRYPPAVVRGNELVFVYQMTTQDAVGIESEFYREREVLKLNLLRIAAQVERFNATIGHSASQQVAARREKLLQDRGIVEKLGFPLKRRSGVPMTYKSPDMRRRIVPKLPEVSAQAHKPEPVIALSDYDHILSVISQMVMVMERSPKAFKDMGEEDLRQHFLVQLNGQYEGQATGETFNYEGRTDILVRTEGKNIFIAECKFWIGPSGISKAIDQLLGYTSWRDTKTALLVFNRDTAMSTVLNAIPHTVRKHPNYRADLDYEVETGFRFAFSHRKDPKRSLTLTVLVFDVPGST